MSLKTRPRRNIVKRVWDFTAVKEEEWALRRALYASLRQTAIKNSASKKEDKISKNKIFSLKKTRQETSSSASSEKMPVRKQSLITKKKGKVSSPLNDDKKPKIIMGKSKSKSSLSKLGSKLLLKRRKDRLVKMKTRSHYQRKEEPKVQNPTRTTRSTTNNASSNNSKSSDNEEKARGRSKTRMKRPRSAPDRSQDKTAVESPETKKRVKKEKVEKLMLAQRKFASSQPCSPSSLLLNQIARPLSERPKTEDFIKFLCLRGTPALPKELEFLNSPCMPPSPLSSDDDEPQYPVSPCFRRQTSSSKSTPYKEAHVKTERQMSDSFLEMNSFPSPRFSPPKKISEKHEYPNGTSPIVNPTPKLVRSTSSPSKLSPPAPKISPLKKAMKFTGKSENALQQRGKTAFTRVCSTRIKKQRSIESTDTDRSISPRGRRTSLDKIACSSVTKGSETVSSDLPLRITTRLSRGGRTVEIQKSPKERKNKRRKKLLDTEPLKGSLAETSKKKKKPVKKGQTAEENVDVLCVYSELSSSDANENEQLKTKAREGPRGSPVKHATKELKGGSPRSNKTRGVKEEGQGSPDKRHVKDMQGRLVVSISSGKSDQCDDSAADDSQGNVSKDKKQNKSRSSSNDTYEKGIPCGKLLKPMEQEFKDPVKFLKKVEAVVSQGGICVVVPPEGWRTSTVINEDIRFNTKLQYIHRMRHRFGQSTRKLAAMKKYLEEVSITMETLPQIGSCEVDLLRISDAMRLFGGLQQVKNMRKWLKLANFLHIPKNAHGRVNRLQDIYLKYVLPYDSLTEDKKEKLDVEVDKECKERIKELCSEDLESKGKSTSVAQFHRMACSAQEMYADKDDTTAALENKFWTIVGKCERHVASPIGEIDASNCGPAFQVSKAKSGWNLSNLPLCMGSALHALGFLSGVTTPTVKFGSVFSTSGWVKREEGFHSVEYLHVGAIRIWYSIPAASEKAFLRCMESKEKEDGYVEPKLRSKYLISPLELMEQGIPVSRTVQNEGQFVFIMPDVYHCVVNTGYCCAEAVNFAPISWILSHRESSMFPVEKLLICIVKEEIEKTKTSEYAEPLLQRFKELREKSLDMMKCLKKMGIQSGESQEVLANMPGPKQRKNIVDWQECSVCSKLCYLVLVNFGSSSRVLCPEHAISEAKENPAILKDMECFTQLSETEWNQLEKRLKKKLEDNELSCHEKLQGES